MTHTYLTFNGNCQEAMEFYKECLGGKLTLQTVAESPMAKKLPVSMQTCILHAALTNEKGTLMGTDMAPAEGLKRGNAISLMLNCESEKEIKKVYQKLSAGGSVTHPIETTFFGALLGGLSDKFGNNWLLYYSKNKN